MKPDSVRFVLFDIGGVLLELNNPVSTFDVDFDEPEFFRRWLLSPSVREFERGSTKPAEFARRITAEFDLRYGPGEFLERFEAWPGELFSYGIELVRRIDRRYVCALLSNTNELHWESFGMHEAFDARFEHVFLSFETGLLKPDRDAFEHVIECLGCAAEDILYFDDNPLNVATASELKMNALICNSEADLENGLVAGGVLA